MEVASKGKLDFIQALLIAKKCGKRNPLCALAPAQLVGVDMSSGSSAQGPLEMAWSWETGPLDGHRFLQSFRKAPAGRRGWQRESQAACGLRDHTVTAWCETGRQKSSWEPDARCVSGM